MNQMSCMEIDMELGVEVVMVIVICVLVMDVVEVVNLGYFGVLMGMVDVVVVLFNCFIIVDLVDDCWLDCDCFVMLVGYGLMLVYVINYMLGYDDMFMVQLCWFW